MTLRFVRCLLPVATFLAATAVLIPGNDPGPAEGTAQYRHHVEILLALDPLAIRKHQIARRNVDRSTQERRQLWMDRNHIGTAAFGRFPAMGQSHREQSGL